MRFLEPAVTCLLATNGKPTLAEALASIATQTRLRDVQVVVLDSGEWLDDPEQRLPHQHGRAERHPDAPSRLFLNLRDLYETYSRHPSIEWVFTGESRGHSETVCPIAYWTNRAIEHGLIRGRSFCTFYDDDLYYPTFFAEMAGYLDSHPDVDAVWCSEAVTRLNVDGRREYLHAIEATRVRHGQTFDCHVDGMQVMIRRRVLWRIQQPWLPEEVPDCHHSDGLFLNKVAAVVDGFHPVPTVLCEHRRTPWSTYTNHTV